MRLPAWKPVAARLSIATHLIRLIACPKQGSWQQPPSHGRRLLYCAPEAMAGKRGKPGWYAVRVGREAGVYRTWDEAKAQVHGFKGAVFKGFASLEEAQHFVQENGGGGGGGGGSSGDGIRGNARRHGADGSAPPRRKQPRLDAGIANSVARGSGAAASGAAAAAAAADALAPVLDPQRLYRLEFAVVLAHGNSPASCGAVLSDAESGVRVGCISQQLSGGSGGEEDGSGVVGPGLWEEEEAGYRALLLGLRATLALGATRLEVAVTSSLLLRQVSGESSVAKTNALRPLYESAVALGNAFEDLQLKRAERCAAAHELAGLAQEYGGYPGVQDSRGERLADEAQLAAAVTAAVGGAAAAAAVEGATVGEAAGAGAVVAEAAGAVGGGLQAGSAAAVVAAAAGVGDGGDGFGIDPRQVYRLEFDGAARGNPGPCGLGALLALEAGGATCEAGRCCYLVPCATNNMAEYGALLLGMAAAARLGVMRLRVLGDSELIVDQVMGRKRVSHPVLRIYHQAVQELRSSFQEFSIAHVYREGNKRADALSNEAIDRGGWEGVRLPDGRLVGVQLPLDLRQVAADAMRNRRGR